MPASSLGKRLMPAESLRLSVAMLPLYVKCSWPEQPQENASTKSCHPVIPQLHSDVDLGTHVLVHR